MNQTAHSIRKEHVDLLRFNNGGHFTGTVRGMGQVLSSAIGARAIVRGAGFGAGSGSARTSGRLERTADAALGTADPRDLPALGDGGDDVAALFLTLGAELIDAIAYSVGRLFRLWLFSWHENKRGVRGHLPQHERVLPEIGPIEFVWSAAEECCTPKGRTTLLITSEARDHCDRHHRRRHRRRHNRRRVRRHRRGFRHHHNRHVHRRHRRVHRGLPGAGLH